MHYKRGATDSSRRDYVTVIAVLVDVTEDLPIGGVWSLLDVAAKQSNTSSPLNITGLVLFDLLPFNRDYYYYEGVFDHPTLQ